MTQLMSENPKRRCRTRAICRIYTWVIIRINVHVACTQACTIVVLIVDINSLRIAMFIPRPIDKFEQILSFLSRKNPICIGIPD